MSASSWLIGGDDENKILAFFTKMVRENIDCAIKSIFDRPSQEMAATSFGISEKGIVVCIWDGDYDFVIPWKRIYFHGEKSQVEKVKRAIDDLADLSS